MKISEQYASVTHSDNCEVCAVTDSKPVISRVTQSAGFIWFLIAGMILGAYTLAIWQLNNIVGGMK